MLSGFFFFFGINDVQVVSWELQLKYSICCSAFCLFDLVVSSSCSRHIILKIVVLKFSCCLILDSGVRRLVIVEAGSKRVEGIVSLSDIFKFFLGQFGLVNEEVKNGMCSGYDTLSPSAYIQATITSEPFKRDFSACYMVISL